MWVKAEMIHQKFINIYRAEKVRVLFFSRNGENQFWLTCFYISINCYQYVTSFLERSWTYNFILHEWRMQITAQMSMERINSSLKVERTNFTFQHEMKMSCAHSPHWKRVLRPASAAVSTTAKAQADTSQHITAGSWFRLADPHTLGYCRGNKTQIPRQRAVIFHYNVNMTILKCFCLLTMPNSWESPSCFSY